MTIWNLNLTEQTDMVFRTLAALDTEEPTVVAAVLRAAADRLDPPKPSRHAMRGHAADWAARQFRVRSDQPADAGGRVDVIGRPLTTDERAILANPIDDLGKIVEPWMQRQAGDAGRQVDVTGTRGVDLVEPPVTVEDDYRRRAEAGTATVVPLDRLDPEDRERPVDVADDRSAFRNAPAGRNPRITPDGCGREHTFTGSCALTPPHRD